MEAHRIRSLLRVPERLHSIEGCVNKRHRYIINVSEENSVLEVLETQSICNLAIDCTADGIHAFISFIESVLQSDQSRPCQPASAVNKIIKDFSLTFLPSLTNRCIAYCCGMAWHTKPLLSSNANRMRCKAPHTHTHKSNTRRSCLHLRRPFEICQEEICLCLLSLPQCQANSIRIRNPDTMKTRESQSVSSDAQSEFTILLLWQRLWNVFKYYLCKN